MKRDRYSRKRKASKQKMVLFLVVFSILFLGSKKLEVYGDSMEVAERKSQEMTFDELEAQTETGNTKEEDTEIKEEEKGLPYKDMKEHELTKDLEVLRQAGVLDHVFVVGNHFMPASSISKGEFISLVISSSHTVVSADYNEPSINGFDSLKAAHKPYVAAAEELGILSKDKDTLLFDDIRGAITREDAVTILGRYLSTPQDSDFVLEELVDKEEIAAYAKGYVGYFYKEEILKADENKSIRPKDYLTRGESIGLVKKYVSEGNVYEDTETSIYAGSSKLGYEDGTKEKASFIMPYGISFYNEDILVADSGSSLIREISDTVKTVIGAVEVVDGSGIPVGGHKDGKSGEALLNHPMYLAVYPNGDIAFTEEGSNHIRKYIKAANAVSTIVGEFDEGASLNGPAGIDIDAGYNLMVADSFNNRICKVSFDGEIEVIAGSGKAGYKDGDVATAEFREPVDVVNMGDVIYVLDAGNSMIRKIENGQVSTVAGKETKLEEETGILEGGYLDGEASKALFRQPQGFYVVDENEMYIADTYNHKVRRLKDGKVTTIAGGSATNAVGTARQAGFTLPTDLIYKDGYLYVTDTGNHTVKKINIKS